MAQRRRLGLASAAFLVAAGVIVISSSAAVQDAAATATGVESVRQPETDRLWLSPPVSQVPQIWAAHAVQELSGVIEQFDAEALRWRPEADGGAASTQSQTFAAERVVDVEPRWANDEVAAAVEIYDRGDFVKAAKAIEAALRSGVPRWQQQILIGYVVDCAMRQNRSASAAKFFLSLVKSRPPAYLLAHAPLIWSSREPDRLMVEQAEAWMASPEPWEQLIAASWLLGIERQRSLELLLRLRSDEDPVVAQLATCQAWRGVSPPDTEANWQEWLAFRDTLPLALQGGPTEFLAERAQRVGWTELAIGQWMRIAANGGQRYDRQELAVQEAVRLMRAAGRNQEAQRLMEWKQSRP